MAQDDYPFRPRLFLISSKPPALDSIHTEEREEICRDAGRRYLFGRAPAGEGKIGCSVSSDLLEGAALILPIQIVGVRGLPLIEDLLPVCLPEMNYLVRFFVWERTDERSVDNSEYGSISSDTES